MNPTNSDPPKGGEEEKKKEAAVMVRMSLNNDKRGHNAAAASSGPRRIVKAAHPKASASSNGNGAAESRQEAEGVLKALPDKHDDEDDEDDELIAKNKHPHHRPDPYLLMRPTAGADSPILREACQEAADRVKRGQVQSSSDRRKVKSEHVKNLVRHPVPKTVEDAGAKDGGDSHSAKPTVATHHVKANPFSRFLSVFSVEPAHPEHKRRYLSSHSGGSDASHSGDEAGVDASPLHPPAVKKARTDEDEDEGEDDNEGCFLGNVDATKADAAAERSSEVSDPPRAAAAAWTRVAASIHHQIRTRPLVASAVAVAAAAVWVACRWHGRGSLPPSTPSSSAAAA